MSFNLYGWNAMGQHRDTKAWRLWKQINDEQPDVLGTQENENPGWVGSETGLAIAPGYGHGAAILYKSSVLEFQAGGKYNLNEMDRWGQRVVVWARFRHKTTGAVFTHWNTHFCVCSENALVGSATTVAEHMARHGGSAILTGDFNVF